MRTVATWTVATLIGLVAVVGLIAFLNSRDQSGVAQQNGGPGSPYRGQPVLSPALRDAVRRGNVVVLYRGAKPPAGTTALIPPGGKVLVRAGQSVVIEREPTLKAPLAAVSAAKIQEANSPQQLAGFIDYWIGRGGTR
jgi:hypothetical protein